ncbi:MAG: DUF2238 domain-containing protein [Nitrospirae bacterium]|nr:DUF2238 domain-containing protein [Nitrospirota bacterium]
MNSGGGRGPHVSLLAFGATVFVWSAIRPHDYFTWALEVFPVVLAVPVLLYTYGRFRLTTLAYVLILVHATILMVGGHYTYAEMPLFNWIRDTFGLARNHYDRLGHFAQGFIPAIIAREIFIRKGAVKRGGWTSFLAVCFALAVSASYELIEWLAAILTGTAATAFLGTQGDVWDTQWDMFMCLAGAVTAVVTLSRVHDRALEKL